MPISPKHSSRCREPLYRYPVRIPDLPLLHIRVLVVRLVYWLVKRLARRRVSCFTVLVSHLRSLIYRCGFGASDEWSVLVFWPLAYGGISIRSDRGAVALEPRNLFWAV